MIIKKETKCDGTCADNECICDELHQCKYCGAMTNQDDEECYKRPKYQSYTIEEIEKAIDDLGFIYDNVKKAIINNLKK